MGDEIEDGLTEEWDIAIARGIMRATWANAVGSVITGVLAFCTGNPCVVFSFLSVGASINTGLRIWSMRPEFRKQISSGELVAALGIAAAGGSLGVLQPIFVALYAIYLSRVG